MLVIAVGAHVNSASPIPGPRDVTLLNTHAGKGGGAILAVVFALCIDCHSSTRDWSKYAGPMADTGIRQRRTIRSNNWLPRNFIAKNITPYSLGDWTDGEILRAVTTGVSKDRHALFPIMEHRTG